MLKALELARRVEAGELTPSKVIELAAENIAKRESEVGAFATLALDHARKSAQDGAVAKKPLRGLPFGLKDIFDTADLPTEYGSTIYRGHRPAADASLVSMITRAGGITIGKTVTTEFAHLDPGKTRNPHNPAHTPGGSSSGSAAGVAAGFFAAATGSQTGGSVIRPASFCGVAGFKPSYRLLPTIGMKCVSWHLDTAGFFAAGVADVAFVTALASKRDLRVDGKTPSAPRIAILRDPPWPAASDDMNRAVEIAARAAEKAGAKLTDIRLPTILGEAYEMHRTVQGYEAAQSLASEYDRHKAELRTTTLEMVESGLSITADEYDNARKVCHRARSGIFEIFDQADVVLSPSAPGAAPLGLASTGTSTFNRLWTLMGTPCVNVPGLQDETGLPLGVQMIGPFGRDRETLEAALFVETALARRG
jgi:Asp-tRNA(Asn)/Glu-tRNA(Gln) amidotransferase A subunit family amidase